MKELTGINKILATMVIIAIVTAWCFGYVHGFNTAYKQTQSFYLNKYDWREHLRIENNVSPSYIYDQEYINKLFLNQTKALLNET